MNLSVDRTRRPWLESLDGIDVSRLHVLTYGGCDDFGDADTYGDGHGDGRAHGGEVTIVTQVLAEELVASRNFHDPSHPQYVTQPRQGFESFQRCVSCQNARFQVPGREPARQR